VQRLRGVEPRKTHDVVQNTHARPTGAQAIIASLAPWHLGVNPNRGRLRFTQREQESAMKQIAVIHLGDANSEEVVSLLDQKVRVLQFGCGGDGDKARALIAEHDGKVDAIGLDGLPAMLELGPFSKPHEVGQTAFCRQKTPVVDGSGIRAGLERWAVILADRAQPGIFAEKHVLMVPGLNHSGLTQALSATRRRALRRSDGLLWLPSFPASAARATWISAAPGTLDQLQGCALPPPLPAAGTPGSERAGAPFEWADVIAGDIGAIRRYAPAQLKRKTVVVECASEEDVADLRGRGVSIVVTLMPSTAGEKSLGRWSAAV
jgi:hypothetical protein